MYGKEQIAYWVYQLSTAAIFVGLFFLRVPLTLSWPVIFGWVVYLFGLVLCSISIVDFSAPSPNGLHQDGIYRFSRNPMYLSYLICFLGMALLTQSMFLFSAVILFQISAHWIILAEERWCSQTFGDLYEQYKKVGKALYLTNMTNILQKICAGGLWRPPADIFCRIIE